MPAKDTLRLRRRQLDRLVALFPAGAAAPAPRRGWVAEIRSALGMSTYQFARRMGKSQSHASQSERREPEGAVTLRTLREMADALECDLVYALVPRAGSLEATVRRRAAAVAADLAASSGLTMALEAQAVGDAALQAQTRDLADDLARAAGSRLWDTPE